MRRTTIILLALMCSAWMRPADLGLSGAPATSPVAFAIKRKISLTIGHTLGAAEAKRRASERFASLQQRFAGKASQSSLVWTGDDGSVRVAAYGQIVTAQILARDTTLEIHVALPDGLAPLGGTIQSFLNKTAIDTLKP